MTEVNFTV